MAKAMGASGHGTFQIIPLGGVGASMLFPGTDKTKDAADEVKRDFEAVVTGEHPTLKRPDVDAPKP